MRFVTSGSDANEMAIQLARSYHVERGEPLALAGDLVRAGVPRADDGDARAHRAARAARPVRPVPAPAPAHPAEHVAFDPTGEAALDGARPRPRAGGSRERLGVLLRGDQRRGAARVHAVRGFWEGLAERRDRHGFLVCFDEVVTGVGRTGRWFAGAATACAPDIIATAKGLGAGYAAIGAVLCREHVYEAVANGSRRFPLGHTWDGAPLSCAVGLAVLEALRSERLIEHVEERGRRLRDELEARWPTSRWCTRSAATGTCSGCRTSIRATASFLPRELRVAGRIDQAAFERGLITLSTQPTRDGYAGDQTLFAPAFTTTDDELAEMVSRFADAVRPRRAGRRAGARREPIADDHGSRPMTETTAARADPPARGAHAARARHRSGWTRTGRTSRRSGSTSTTARSTRLATT